jgi:hypothetical protein
MDVKGDVDGVCAYVLVVFVVVVRVCERKKLDIVHNFIYFVVLM